LVAAQRDACLRCSDESIDAVDVERDRVAIVSACRRSHATTMRALPTPMRGTDRHQDPRRRLQLSNGAHLDLAVAGQRARNQRAIASSGAAWA
jgi:hypothetical protein